jgi:hypothetical protein
MLQRTPHIHVVLPSRIPIHQSAFSTIHYQTIKRNSKSHVLPYYGNSSNTEA